jgi:branched-chain amino acid transport system substrate-binding protein
LVKTDIAGHLLPLPWRGVRFNEKGQNTLGSVIMIQWQDKKQRVIWPKEVAETDVIFPLPPWSKR